MRVRYLIIFAGVFLAVIFLAVWLPNWRFLWHFPKEGLLTTLSSLQANFSPLSAGIVVVIAAEAGAYVALLAATSARSGVGFWGMLVGFLGIGCASCGSVVLTGLLGLAAATAFLGVLPFRGKEFGFLAIALLGVSIVSLIKKLRTDSCKIDQ